MNLKCPKCSNDADDAGIAGIEIPEAYDGISFWKCEKCGTEWSRWTGEIIPTGLPQRDLASLARHQRERSFIEKRRVKNETATD